MRFDKSGRPHTLDEDIIETFKNHGLEVVEEKFQKDTWIIKARRKAKVEA